MHRKSLFLLPQDVSVKAMCGRTFCNMPVNFAFVIHPKWIFLLHFQNRVEINDVDHEVMKEMLRFFYTGKAPNLEKMADDLLAAADKVSLNFSKHFSLSIFSSCVMMTSFRFSFFAVCSGAFKSDVWRGAVLQFNRRKCIRSFSFSRFAHSRATQNSCNRLYQQVRIGDLAFWVSSCFYIPFISPISHATDVMETPGWTHMLQSQPHLVADAFKAMASQQSPPLGPPRKRVKQSWTFIPFIISPAESVSIWGCVIIKCCRLFPVKSSSGFIRGSCVMLCLLSSSKVVAVVSATGLHIQWFD